MKQCLHKQRGAVTLVAALFILITIALMVEVLHRAAGSDVLDTAIQNDSVEALFLAESGLERATARYVAGSCDSSLAESSIGFGRGSFTIENIGAAFNTDFSGAALAPGQCRIRVSGTVPMLGAQRIIEAIVTSGGNLLVNANADFNDPETCAGSCQPTGWTLPAGGWVEDDSPDGDGIADRAAYVEKPSPGNKTFTTAGSFGLSPFTVTAPTTLTLNFDYRVSTSGSSSKEAEYSFSVTDGTNVYDAVVTQPPAGESGDSGGYQTGTSTIFIGGSGSVTITEFSFRLFAKAGQPKQVWLDNLDLQDPATGGTVALQQWRELISN